MLRGAYVGAKLGIEQKVRVVRGHLAAVVMLTFFILPTSCTAIFRTFVCKEFDQIGSFLVSDYAVECFTPRHNAHMFVAAFLIVIYVCDFWPL